MSEIVEMKLLSDPRLLAVLRATTGQIASIAGFESHQIEQIKLAVDELCTNIIRHTYGGNPEAEINLSFRLLEKGIEIEVQDFGEKVDPRILREAGTRRSGPGGLGISLIRSVMDKIEYSLPTAVGNRCRMVKLLGKKEP